MSIFKSVSFLLNFDMELEEADLCKCIKLRKATQEEFEELLNHLHIPASIKEDLRRKGFRFDISEYLRVPAKFVLQIIKSFPKEREPLLPSFEKENNFLFDLMVNEFQKGDLRLGPYIKEPIYLEPGDCLLPYLPKKGLGKTRAGGISDKPFGKLFFLNKEDITQLKQVVKDKGEEICGYPRNLE